MPKYFPDVYLSFFETIPSEAGAQIERRTHEGHHAVEKLSNGYPASAPNFEGKFNPMRLVLFFVEHGLIHARARLRN